MSEPLTTQLAIQYNEFPRRHKSIIEDEINEFKEKGINFSLNYHVAFTTWQEMRRARGMVVQSLANKERIEEEYRYTNDKVEQKLSSNEIDRLCNLVTLASLNNGVLFWTKELKPDNKLLRMHTKVLENIREMSAQVQNPDKYSRFGNAQVMYTLSEWVINYFEQGVSKSDNLGDHFANCGKPHVFMDGISINSLKDEIKLNPSKIIVLAAAVSSGVLEAGIFAHYMSQKLKLPTTVDPVFFSKSHSGREPINVINSILPVQNRIVIPLDDRVYSKGFSASQSKEGAERKYGGNSLIVSKKMQEFSEIWKSK